MRETEYGKKVGKAIHAVIEMETQVSRMLKDCDGLFPDYESVFKNTVTTELTHVKETDFWMADGVYSYWHKPKSGTPGLLVIFFRNSNDEEEQPLLVVGNINYLGITSENMKEKCKSWDLWHGATDWSPKPLRLNEVIDLPHEEDWKRIDKLKLIVVPLFQIENLKDIQVLFEKVGVQTKPV